MSPAHSPRLDRFLRSAQDWSTEVWARAVERSTAQQSEVDEAWDALVAAERGPGGTTRRRAVHEAASARFSMLAGALEGQGIDVARARRVFLMAAHGVAARAAQVDCHVGERDACSVLVAPFGTLREDHVEGPVAADDEAHADVGPVLDGVTGLWPEALEGVADFAGGVLFVDDARPIERARITYLTHAGLRRWWWQGGACPARWFAQTVRATVPTSQWTYDEPNSGGILAGLSREARSELLGLPHAAMRALLSMEPSYRDTGALNEIVTTRVQRALAREDRRGNSVSKARGKRIERWVHRGMAGALDLPDVTTLRVGQAAFEVPLPATVRGVPIRGRVDMIAQTTDAAGRPGERVVDWKAWGSDDRGEDETDARWYRPDDNDDQIRFYAAARSVVDGARPVAAEIHRLADGTVRQVGLDRLKGPTVDRIVATWNQIVDRQERGEWETTTHPSAGVCRGCPLLAVCPNAVIDTSAAPP